MEINRESSTKRQFIIVFFLICFFTVIFVANVKPTDTLYFTLANDFCKEGEVLIGKSYTADICVVNERVRLFKCFRDEKVEDIREGIVYEKCYWLETGEVE